MPRKVHLNQRIIISKKIIQKRNEKMTQEEKDELIRRIITGEKTGKPVVADLNHLATKYRYNKIKSILEIILVLFICWFPIHKVNGPLANNANNRLLLVLGIATLVGLCYMIYADTVKPTMRSLDETPDATDNYHVAIISLNNELDLAMIKKYNPTLVDKLIFAEIMFHGKETFKIFKHNKDFKSSYKLLNDRKISDIELEKARKTYQEALGQIEKKVNPLIDPDLENVNKKAVENNK